MRKLGDWAKQCSETATGLMGWLPAIFRAIYHTYPPAGKAETFSVRLKQQYETVVGTICLFLFFLLTAIDYFFTPQISFTLFYLLVVAYGAWSGGKKTGIFIVLMSPFALLAHEVRTTDEHSWDLAMLWNLGAQMGVYLFVALLVSAVRSLTENLERRVKDRTAALEREIGERKQTEEQLRKTTQQFRQLAENITDTFWMRNSQEARMVYVSPAYETIWGRSCKELYQSPQAWLEAIHPEDRDRVAQAILNKQSAGEYNQEYRIVRPDSTLRWIRDRAFPIRDSTGRVTRIVGIAEDITDRRRLEREILEISDREQARIGQDLHDSLCQKLVSVAFDNNSLEQKLTLRSLNEAALAQQIAAVLDDVITEARALARGLFPVQLETNGLGVALQQLAASVTARTKVNCRMECLEPVLLRDNAVATHLYRIAQEAVNNALKHAKAGSILIRLDVSGDQIELEVKDDGIGIPPSSGGGMGLHIMDYRARTISGRLSIRQRTEGGTIISCFAPHSPIEGV